MGRTEVPCPPPPLYLRKRAQRRATLKRIYFTTNEVDSKVRKFLGNLGKFLAKVLTKGDTRVIEWWKVVSSGK